MKFGVAGAKMKLCVIFNVFLSCFCVAIVGAAEAESGQPSTPNPNPNAESKCAFKCEDFKALEKKNLELEQSYAELVEQVKSLSKKFDELKSEISPDHGVWLLTPKLRGPPGKDGKQGEKGELGRQGSLEPNREQGDQAPELITSCNVAMETLPSPQPNKQWIYPEGGKNKRKVEVLCDFETDGGGWTVIQKRSKGPKDEFNQTWNNYKNGFGSLDKNFWLGLENIHALTKNGNQELRIELEDFEGEKAYAKYSNFSISDASDFYRLSFGKFLGDSTSGDSMTNSAYSQNNGMRFTTKDVDNDNWPGGNCAVEHGDGGWWFNQCGASGLNGLYFEKGATTTEGYKGIFWTSWKGDESLAKSEMKIRTRKFQSK